MDFSSRVWKFYVADWFREKHMDLSLILQLILEGLKALKKDKIEELEKAWKKYESELTQALASGDVARINAILAELRAL